MTGLRPKINGRGSPIFLALSFNRVQARLLKLTSRVACSVAYGTSSY